MKTLLILAALIGLSLISCTKEEPFYPNQKEGTWFIKIEGSFGDSFHVELYQSRLPYRRVVYIDRIGGGNDLFKMQLAPNDYCAIKYMDTDSVVKLIEHQPSKVMNIYDTIPATMW